MSNLRNNADIKYTEMTRKLGRNKLNKTGYLSYYLTQVLTLSSLHLNKITPFFHHAARSGLMKGLFDIVSRGLIRLIQ